MKFIHRAALVVLVALPANAPPAVAAEPEVIRRLRGEAVTVFDAGIKLLRRSAIDASRRLSSPAEPGPRSRVWYDSNDGTIEIEFRFAVPAGEKETLTKGRCLERRNTAIRETFNIDRTIYTVPLSFGERVRRRLGRLFSLEPLENANQLIAVGESMSRLTFLSVRLAGDKDAFAVTCRDPVVPITGSR